jgi:hypothetical protein
MFMTTTVIRLDVWGGEASMDHLARTHFTTIEAAQDVLAREVKSGFLVNIRALGPGEGWGSSDEFDVRAPLTTGHA